MNIIIPCSGVGKRFQDAGYGTTKPLIPIHFSKLHTILGEVVQQFSPEEDKFIFIANKENVDDIFEWVQSWSSHFYPDMDCTVTSVDHKKLGPVGALFDALDDLRRFVRKDEGIIVSYCDFGAIFDYKSFKEFVKDDSACIMSYTGYHPHLQNPKNVYAVPIMVDDRYVSHVYEKHFIEVEDRKNFHHSSGAYYFKHFTTFTHYVSEMMTRGETLNGEYYVSLLMNLLIDDEFKVSSWAGIKYFYQLGTPEDLNIFREQYKKYYNSKFRLIENLFENQVMLMAGRSERFTQAGYLAPKPFMKIRDQQMHLIQESNLFASYRRYVTADDYVDYTVGSDRNYKFIEKNKVGPAYSYFLGANDIKGEVIITSCDIFCEYDSYDFTSSKDKFDVIVFATQNHSQSLKNPKSFSWIDHTGPIVHSVSLKKPLNEKADKEDYLLIGSFWVKNNEKFIKIVKDFLGVQKPDGGEYYLDEVINYCLLEGLSVGTALVNGYYSFGTPDEYLESKYWLECFR